MNIVSRGKTQNYTVKIFWNIARMILLRMINTVFYSVLILCYYSPEISLFGGVENKSAWTIRWSRRRRRRVLDVFILQAEPERR